VSGVRYCPRCEAIAQTERVTCVMCGLDFAEHEPLLEPPSYSRNLAEMQERQDREPNKALGVMAWVAQLSATLAIVFFCVLPAIAFVIALLIILFTR
jgi:hypothetical protein